MSCGASDSKFDSKQHTEDTRLGVTTLARDEDDDDVEEEEEEWDESSLTGAAVSLSATVDDRPDTHGGPVNVTIIIISIIIIIHTGTVLMSITPTCTPQKLSAFLTGSVY